MNVGCVKSCCRFIKNINGFARASFRKLGCELDTLSLTAGKCCCTLTDFNISQADILKSFKLTVNFRLCFKKLCTFINSHFKNIKNGFSFKFDIKSFPVISLSSANLARNINISKKMHFNFNNTVTLASLTSTALNIKRKAICLIPLLLSVGGLSVKFSNIVKNACVCCRI